MNKTTEALKLAEEALDRSCGAISVLAAMGIQTAQSVLQDNDKALAAIREALAEQAIDELQAVGQEIQPEYYFEPVLTGFKITTVDGQLEFEPVYSEPVKRPPNCGTGYCSCIECPYEPVSIPDHITCPFCESDHVPDWLHDLKLDAKAIRARSEK